MAHSGRGESSSSSGPCNSPPNWKYDVFLSFAGKDTRLKFTNHLDEAFKRSGIKTFRDDVDLERGRNIKQSLFQAIQHSLCAVVIISKTYANSKWCLDELQEIVESQNTNGVFPIFYDVDPADAREKGWDEISVPYLVGLGWREADLIEEIVREVWTYLLPKLPSYGHNLVGIESRATDMISYLEIGVDDMRFVGIWGMGGVGKTTLAKVVFEKLSRKFEVCCFLDNVRETFKKEGNVVSLQKRLLSRLQIKYMDYGEYEGMEMIRNRLCNKKVLLVIDDVDHENQVNNLAQSPNWFGKGSRIIFTTRDKHLLISSGVDEQRIYEMKTRKEGEALELFSNKAFNEGHLPDEDYLKLSKSVIEYAQGLPLALTVLGSFLRRRKKAVWEDTLDKLKKSYLAKDISQVLKISYDGLDEKQQAIFLDIACFFKGWLKEEVTQVLESCGLNPVVGIDVLIERTLLVETKDSTLEMHDLLQKLGRNIVHQDSPKNVGKRSRLWEFKDIKEVLENNTGSEAIEAIFMQGLFEDRQDKIEVHPEAFSKMSNLRLFLCTMGGNPFMFPGEWKFLAGALKVVEWSYPLKAFPPETQLNELVEMRMSYSKIKQLWNNKQPMTKLKSIKLANSLNLTETPDLSGVPNLEHLHLGGCTSLVKVHPSLGQLRKLVEVDLNNCANIEILPKKLETNSLVKLNLRGCKKVAELPEFGKGMEKISYLDVGATSITRLPESVGSLTGLRYLNLSGCKIENLNKLLKTHVSHQISNLNVTFLTELYLSRCGLDDGSIPDFDSLSSLIILELSGNDFVNLPIGCFSGLSRLVSLSLDCCRSLTSLPRLPPRLIRLNASNCDSMEPLSSDGQLWNLVASLDHECRGRTKYEIYDDEEDADFVPFKAGKRPPPLRDFCAILPGYEIPSWFPTKEDCPFDKWGEYEMKVDIPPYFRDSEWCGIVVCSHMSAYGDGFWDVGWSSKAAEDDDDYKPKGWEHDIPFSISEKQCIMVLELNEETCWRHLRAHHSNSLHILLSVQPLGYDIEVKECGWRVIRKEEIQDWCHLNGFFNQATQPQLASSDEVKLPRRALKEFFLGEMYLSF
ncbi:TMV resistance protein N-like [Neltuma alba]|uniref:TMV resistance protein N-like n=1 Tax=Neltuma alba TaxID=207710 RepID=UPI0010A4A086|nr:TMV resistance protein N-like [Prosopis alba]